MNLVLVVLRGRLWGHVVDVVDLRGAGVVVGLLYRVGSLGRMFGGLGVMGLVELLILESPLWRHRGLMMTFKTLPTLVGVAVAVQLKREGGRFVTVFMQKLRGGMVGLCLVHLVGLMEQLGGGVMGLGFVHLVEHF